MLKQIGIFELNDCELKFSFSGNSWSSAGFATLTEQSVIFGEQSRQQARLQPLVSFSQYWNQLSLSPVQHGNDRFRHYGDFVYHQLLELHSHAPQCKQVVLAIPASFSREQLSLLLGICDALPFKVVGMVDSAIISVADKVGKGHYLHLDMQLHQCLLSEISIDSNIHIASADIISGTGLVNLYHHWAKYLSTQFIQQCRFDPMHDAQSEQALYDLLPKLLNQDRNIEEVQLSLANKQVKLNRQSLQRHSQTLFDSVVKAVAAASQNDCVFITSRIAQVPELSSRLHNTFVLDEKAIERNIERHQADLIGSGSQVGFTTALSATHLSPDPVVNCAAKSASHVLYRQNAYPINHNPVYITVLDELSLSSKASPDAQFVLKRQAKSQAVTLTLLQDSKALLNGKQAQNAEQLGAGDVLSLGQQGFEIQLINVLEGIDG